MVIFLLLVLVVPMGALMWATPPGKNGARFKRSERQYLAAAAVVAVSLVLGITYACARAGADFGPLIKTLKAEEGFRSHPYDDSRGVLSIGYGTNIGDGITRAEAEYLLRERLSRTWTELRKAWPTVGTLPTPAQFAVLDMGYQLGTAGLLGFHKMLAALAKGDYNAAVKEAESSAWARETPNRARRVVRVFRKLVK